jgi:uncharacterized protein YdeI (YjbR/CyaY-like superfamily)
VSVAIEADDEPLPTDTVPPDLAAALKQSAAAAGTWKVLRPSRKREHVKAVVTAKKPETRARRITTVIAELASSGETPRSGSRRSPASRAGARTRTSGPTKG